MPAHSAAGRHLSLPSAIVPAHSAVVASNTQLTKYYNIHISVIWLSTLITHDTARKSAVLTSTVFIMFFFFISKVKETIYLVWSFKIEHSPEHKAQCVLQLAHFHTQVFPSIPLMKGNLSSYVT